MWYIKSTSVLTHKSFWIIGVNSLQHIFTMMAATLLKTLLLLFMGTLLCQAAVVSGKSGSILLLRETFKKIQ